MNYIQELTRLKIINDLSYYYDTNFNNYSDNELNIFFTKHVKKNKQEISMIDFYNLKDKTVLIESLDGFVKVGNKIKKENLECYTLSLIDNRKLSGAFNHLVETERGWIKLIDLTKNDFVLTIDGFIKVKNIRQIKTQEVYDLECLHINHRYLSNGISNHNSGKSYLAIMFMDWFKKNFDISANFDVLTNSKILQEQYTQDFDFMNSLWGKGSYHCDTYDTDCGTGGEWCRIQNKKCEACPYSTAKYRFENGDVALTNFHLFLTYMVYMPQAWKRSSRVLVVDECLHPDTLITIGDDTKKKIIDVKIGDIVKTVNEQTKKIENKPVKKLHKNLNKGQQMYEIELENGSTIKITGNHKAKLTNGQWKKVENLDGTEDILYINEIESH